MNKMFKLTTAYFDSQDIPYEVLEESDETAFLIQSQMNNLDTMIVCAQFFDDDDNSVQIYSCDYCKIPENKVSDMYEICSGLNKKYRWVKFFVNEENGFIIAESDAVVDLETVGERVYELIGLMYGICDEAYPEFMRAIWA